MTKLEGQQLVLDTNVLVYWLRGSDVAQRLRAEYDLGSRRPRPIIPVVAKGEIRSFALRNGWQAAKLDALDRILRELPVADISSEPVIQAYATLHSACTRGGVTIGQNDLWIASIALVQGAVVLTTDGDFNRLPKGIVQVERLDVRRNP